MQGHANFRNVQDHGALDEQSCTFCKEFAALSSSFNLVSCYVLFCLIVVVSGQGHELPDTSPAQWDQLNVNWFPVGVERVSAEADSDYLECNRCQFSGEN